MLVTSDSNFSTKIFKIVARDETRTQNNNKKTKETYKNYKIQTKFSPPTIILLSTALSFSWSFWCSFLNKSKNHAVLVKIYKGRVFFFSFQVHLF